MQKKTELPELTKRDIEISLFIDGDCRNSRICKDRLILNKTYRYLSSKYNLSGNRCREISEAFCKLTRRRVKDNYMGAFAEYCHSDTLFHSINCKNINRAKKLGLIAKTISSKRRYLI